MRQTGVACDMGCLVIGSGMSGEHLLSGLSFFLEARGAAVETFDALGASALHANLQAAYQRARRGRETSCIAAEGAGCDCALAVAGQLPADRLLLVDRPGAPRPDARELRRVRGYARRNAVFCVSDVLAVVIGGAVGARGLWALDDQLCNCRVWRVGLSEELWTNRKDQIKKALYRFICEGVLPKSLAENPEMCIIYG